MDALEADAREYEECDTALASEFNSDTDEGAVANCACWNAMGENYRTANFDCILTGNSTINHLYAHQCNRNF